MKFNWKFSEFLLLILEIIFFLIGSCFIFPLLIIIGFIYSIIKHLFIKYDYSISKHLTPIIRSINLAFDGLANACSGELLNDFFKPIIKFGKWYQTISAITGLNYYKGLDLKLRLFLDKVLGKNHCIKAITPEEKVFYNINK